MSEIVEKKPFIVNLSSKISKFGKDSKSLMDSTSIYNFEASTKSKTAIIPIIHRSSMQLFTTPASHTNRSISSSTNPTSYRERKISFRKLFDSETKEKNSIFLSDNVNKRPFRDTFSRPSKVRKNYTSNSCSDVLKAVKVKVEIPPTDSFPDSDESIVELTQSSSGIEDANDSDYLCSASVCNRKPAKKKRIYKPCENKFDEAWKKLYPCIEYDTNRNVMFCKICRNNMQGSLNSRAAYFANGTSNFKIQTIIRHVNSNLHKTFEFKEPTTTESNNVQSDTDKKCTDSFIMTRCRKKRITDDIEKQSVKFWQSEFPFIQYDEKEDVMYCKVCAEFSGMIKKCAHFIAGSNKLKKSAIVLHQLSEFHVQCQSFSDRILNENNLINEDKFSRVLNLIYFIMKTEQCFQYFQKLSAKDKDSMDLGFLYTSYERVVSNFAKYIATGLEKNLLQELASTKNFTLVIDEFCNQSIHAYLVYIKYHRASQISTSFIGIVDHTDLQSESLHEKILALLSKFQIENSKGSISFLVCDLPLEAGIMKVDMINHLKRESGNKFVCDVPLLTHKLRRFREIFQDHPITNKLSVLIRNIYWYCNILRARNFLPNIHKVLDIIKREHKCFPNDNFEFLYFDSLVAVGEDWLLLVQLLKKQNTKHSDPKIVRSGTNILNLITKSNFIFILGLVSDIFSCLSNFADKMESGNTTCFNLCEELLNLSFEVAETSEGKGKYFLKFMQEIDSRNSTFRDTPITIYENVNDVIDDICPIGNAFELRLNTIIDNTPLLTYCQIFNCRNWPNNEELLKFGNCEYLKICEMFQKSTAGLSEWNSYKEAITTSLNPDVRINQMAVVQNTFEMFSSKFPTVTAILKNLLLLDFKSPPLLMGTKVMQSNKSTDKSFFKVENLHNSMVIAVNGPSLEMFNPYHAIESSQYKEIEQLLESNGQFAKDVQIIHSYCDYLEPFCKPFT